MRCGFLLEIEEVFFDLQFFINEDGLLTLYVGAWGIKLSSFDAGLAIEFVDFETFGDLAIQVLIYLVDYDVGDLVKFFVELVGVFPNVKFKEGLDLLLLL
jgi:hypothetical protein